MDEEDTSLNMLKWGLATKKAKNFSIRIALNILWDAWSVPNNYDTLERWCREGLRWQKEDLVNSLGPMYVAELCSSCHPSNLSQDAALLVLTKLVRDMPEESLALLERIVHAPLTVCHFDVSLSDSNLQERKCELVFMVKSFLHHVQALVQRILSSSAKEKSVKFKQAKKSYKKARKMSFQHKPVVEETRKDLQVFETKVKDRYQKRKRLFSFQSSRHMSSSVDNSESIEMSPFSYSSSNSNAECVSNIDSLETFDCDEAGTLLSEVVSCVAESYAFQNPLIEENKNFQSDDDDSMEDERRARLDSNASAEKVEFNLKEDLAHHQVHVKKLRQEIKNFREKVSPFVSEIEQKINDALRAIEDAVNLTSEKDIDEASAFIDSVRQSNAGKYIHRLRQAFLTLIRKRHSTVDLWKWFSSYVYDRVHVVSASPLRLINRSTSAKCSMKQILPTSDISRFTIIVGPIGSGKSYIVKYLLCKWSRKFHDINCPFDYDAMIPVTSSFFTSFQSIDEYISEILTINSSTDLLHSVSAKSYVSEMRLLFIAEIDSSSNFEKIKELINEVVTSNHSSRIVFTCRHEILKSLQTLILGVQEDAKVFELLCLNESLLSKFVLFHIENEDSMRQFCSLYEAMNLESNLRHPLFILMSLYLWKRGVSFLASATCLSKLVMSVMIDFHLRAADYRFLNFGGESERSYNFADSCVKMLCETVWDDYSYTSVVEEIDGLLEVRSPSDAYQELFHPFLIYVENRCYLAHSAFKELLLGVYLAGKLCEKRFFLSNCCVTLATESLDVKRRKLSTECLIVAAGIWSLSENLQQKVADKLAMLYASNASVNPVQWLRFVGETGQSKQICSAVARQMEWKTVWNGNAFSLEENVAVSELLRLEAYHPSKIIIGVNCPGNIELLSTLAICPSVLVALRLEKHFYNWNDMEVNDDLVELLQPAGNLVELWAHLDGRGAYALRHMKKMKELNLRITSSDALVTFSTVLYKMSSLHSLSLRINIPHNANLSAIPSLNSYKGSLWLRFWNVTDSVSEWIIEAINRMHRKPTEVHLQHSCLSPDILQNFKSSVGAAKVYISM